MADSDKAEKSSKTKTEKSEPKATGWKISEGLRQLLNSHAEYIAAEEKKKTDVSAMVEKWLEERLRQEERKRALRTLGIEEKDLSKRGHKS